MKDKGICIIIIILVFFLGFHAGTFNRENFNFSIIRPFYWRRGPSTFSPSQHFFVFDQCKQ